jgi:hypothetical protein
LFFGLASGFFAKKWRQATSAELPTELVRRSSEAPHITYGGLQMRVRDGKRYGTGASLTLPPLEVAGFLLHPRLPAVAGLTPGPQAFYFPCAPRRRYKVDA